MATFEVHIPAADPSKFNTTLKVNADNWMSALKAGMAKLGEQGANVQNVLVDIQEDESIHVTESESGRVFRIRALTDDEVAHAQVKVRPPSGSRLEPVRPSDTTQPGVLPSSQAITEPVSPAKPSAEAMAKTLTDLPVHSVAAAAAATVTTKPEGKAAARPAIVEPAKAAASKKPGNKSSPRIEVEDLEIEELEHPTKPAGNIGRVKSTPDVARSLKAQVEDILADIFLRVQEINGKSPEEALYFILDLALEKVPADAGSVLRADAGSGDLTFLAARGPKSNELLKSGIKIPSGSGFAGFCAAEGVSVAVSDVQKDQRYYAEVAEKLGYETKSLLCAPMMTHGRSFGCLQIINRKGGTSFVQHEVGVLSYLAHQAALFLNSR